MRRPSPSRSPKRPSKTRSLAALALVALVAAGCQDHRQRRAEHAVESYLRAQGAAGYELKRTHCSRVARIVAAQLETHVFLCTVPTHGVTCDEFKATVVAKRTEFAVTRRRRAIDCVQPLQ